MLCSLTPLIPLSKNVKCSCIIAKLYGNDNFLKNYWVLQQLERNSGKIFIAIIFKGCSTTTPSEIGFADLC